MGIGAGGLFVLAALFNENLASFFEAAGLDRGWTLIDPTVRVVASSIQLLGHPIMTHFYAFIVGMLACMAVVTWAVEHNRSTPKTDKLITLSELLDHLTDASAWAKRQAVITDRAVEFEFIDALCHGRIDAFARPVDDYGQVSALTRITPTYFGGVVIDLAAIRADRARQIRLKTGYHGDQFDHWQFRRSQVESVWPSYVPTRAKREKVKT